MSNLPQISAAKIEVMKIVCKYAPISTKAITGKLTEILRSLSGDGNTVIVLEHNLDVIKPADYIIDIGPCLLYTSRCV